MADMPQTTSVGRATLAIAIPAFGRAEEIASTVSLMSDDARTNGLNVSFYISDDTQDDTVRVALEPLRAAGIDVHYRSNRPALRHDRNLLATLLWPEADYVWLLGSAIRVRPGYLAQVHAFLTDQDFLFVNAHSDDHRLIPSLDGEDARILLRDLLWHQTATGATIYGRRPRIWLRERGDAMVVKPDFPQLSVIMGFAAADHAKIGWFGTPALTLVESSTPSYWYAKAVDVFAYNWTAVIAAFPTVILPAERARVAREHSSRVDLFNTTALRKFKRSGQYRWRSLKDPGFREAMHLPLWKLVAVLALPLWFSGLMSDALAQAKRLRP